MPSEYQENMRKAEPLTVQQAADLAGITWREAHNAVMNGSMYSLREGGRRSPRVGDVERYMQARAENPILAIMNGATEAESWAF